MYVVGALSLFEEQLLHVLLHEHHGRAAVQSAAGAQLRKALRVDQH